MENQICFRCKKRPAVKTRKWTTDGVTRAFYYCANCYEEVFLSNEEETVEENNSSSVGVCPECGTTSQEFFAIGLVGCASCYKYLEKDVLPTIVKLQVGRAHCGKRTALTEEREVLILKRNNEREQVERCLAEHRYEQAQGHLKNLKELNKLLYGGES